MNLIDEAVIVEILGIRMYAFGVYVALGALCAAVVLAIAGRTLRLKKGTVPLTAVLGGICGMVISRLSFCLLNQELGMMTPVSFWPQLDGGGWSMFGLIGGMWLGGLISSKIMKEKTGKVLDALSLAMLPLIAAERFGENRIEDFDISRPLDSTFLQGSFLAVGEDEPCLATYYVAAAVAVIIFLVLAFRFVRKERAGAVTIAFLLLFGVDDGRRHAGPELSAGRMLPLRFPVRAGGLHGPHVPGFLRHPGRAFLHAADPGPPPDGRPGAAERAGRSLDPAACQTRRRADRLPA